MHVCSERSTQETLNHKEHSIIIKWSWQEVFTKNKNNLRILNIVT